MGNACAGKANGAAMERPPTNRPTRKMDEIYNKMEKQESTNDLKKSLDKFGKATSEEKKALTESQKM